MVQVVTQAANYQSKTLNLTENFPPLCLSQDSKHHLSDVESVSPVVISHIPVVFLHAQQPPAEHFIINVKSFHQIKVEEHPETCFEGAIVIQIQVIECKVVELEIC